jgi:hypothetical protein
MNLDDPKITAYALGEAGEEIFLDGDGARIVEETVLVAGILRRQLRRRRRKLYLVRYALAACLVMAVGGMAFVSSRLPSRQTVASVKVVAPVAEKKVGEPILHLMPRLADAGLGSCLARAEFKGDRAGDVQELVEAVLQDASRVGSFTSLRLMPEEFAVVQ